MADDQRPLWLDITRASAYLGLSSRALLRLADEGTIPAHRLGRGVRCRRVDLDTWLQRAVPEAAAAVTVDDTVIPDEDDTSARLLELTYPGPPLWLTPDDNEQERSVTRQARLLAAFADAWVDGTGPVPCPVCARVCGRSDIAEHLLKHR